MPVKKNLKSSAAARSFIIKYIKEILYIFAGMVIVLVRLFSRQSGQVRYGFAFYWWQIAFFAAGLFLVLFGIKKIQVKKAREQFDIAKAFYQYKDFVTFEQLGYFLKITPKEAAILLAQYEDYGFLNIEKIDWQKLILWPKGKREVPMLPEPQMVLYPKKEREALLPYTIGLSWVLYALAFPLYRMWDFAAALIFSLVVFTCASALWKGKRGFDEKDQIQAKATGNSIIDEFTQKSMTFLAEMKLMAQKLQKTKAGPVVYETLSLAQKLFDIVQMDDQKIRNIQPFIDYYLPTTMKILKEYEKISALPQGGKNVSEMTGKIEEVLKKLKKAFAAEIDRVYGENTLDISAEITVFDHMIETEILDRQQ